jgi:phosphoadenosine phosphosulfate reductase
LSQLDVSGISWVAQMLSTQTVPHASNADPRMFAACRDRDTERGVADGLRALEDALDAYAGQIAVVSSFGAESAVLLALVANIDPATPVLFVDTGRHFAETLEYRDELAAALGLRDVRDVRPTAAEVAKRDPVALLYGFDPDSCCELRKVEPLEQALAPFAAWVTGRKRAQATTRAAMPLREQVDGKFKINPLAYWDAARIEAEITRRGLPRHPLVERGYKSIGCEVCTRAVRPDEDARAGRWAGMGKIECGLHRAPANIGA